MNPFYEKACRAESVYMDWQTMYPKPYCKEEVDPYTKVRIILMNGTEFEATWFSHQFHRHCSDNSLRRQLSILRRAEQQQQKRLACLKPANESILEHTIGYEQLAVDLTAILAVCRQKISQALMGNKNGFGHPCSEEKKIGESQKGKKFTEEHKKRMSEAAKKRHVPCSEEKRQKLSKNYPNKKKVYCEELNKIFESVRQCGRELGILATSISSLCRGRGKTRKGYHLKYYDDTINA